MSTSILPRYGAAFADNAIGILLAVIAAKQFPDKQLALQMVAMVAAYLFYYFIFETLLSATPGKLVTDLRVRSMDGGKCSAKQIAIRTVTRLLEVNPIFLGAIPAAILICGLPTVDDGATDSRAPTWSLASDAAPND